MSYLLKPEDEDEINKDSSNESKFQSKTSLKPEINNQPNVNFKSKPNLFTAVSSNNVEAKGKELYTRLTRSGALKNSTEALKIKSLINSNNSNLKSSKPNETNQKNDKNTTVYSIVSEVESNPSNESDPSDLINNEASFVPFRNSRRRSKSRSLGNRKDWEEFQKHQNIVQWTASNNLVRNRSHIKPLLGTTRLFKTLSDESNCGTWNQLFQSALELPQNSTKQELIRAESIAKISQDFVSSATMYGRIIISEVSFPNDQKTIKITNEFGGNAGGEKYSINGILFKFAIDWKGIYTNDEYAIKSASHELKSLEQLLDFSPKIRVPLIALIDYLGYRLIAFSLLPINQDTLVYGSDDSGHNVKSFDPDLTLENAGKILNLKNHIAGQNKEKTCVVRFPADVEGHKGTDNRFYLLDLARLMPPTFPNKSKVSSQYLFRLFRPEFVRSYKIPLSPDSFSNFEKCDPDAKLNKKEIEEATQALMEYIPVRVTSLEATCAFNYTTKSSQFVNHIHKSGINLRYLPLVRKKAGPYLRIFCMLEMITRGLKSYLRELFRISKKDQMTVQLYRSSIIDQFNIILGNTPQTKRKTTIFWADLHKRLMLQFDDFPTSEMLRKELNRDLVGVFLFNNICPSSSQLQDEMTAMISYECFTCGLLYPQSICQVCANSCHKTHTLSSPKWRSCTYCSCNSPTCPRTFNFHPSEKHPLKEYADIIGIDKIFERTCYLAGLVISKDALRELSENPTAFIFVISDIKDIRLKSRQLTITKFAEAQALHLKGIISEVQNHERNRIFRQSNKLFEKTIKMNPGAQYLRVTFLKYLFEQIKKLDDSIDEEIVNKCVTYCQDLKDIVMAREIIKFLFYKKNSPKLSESLQTAFSVVLEQGQNLKTGERIEILEFIIHYGLSLISLDLSSNQYSMILDDNILSKLSIKCSSIIYLKLNYNPKRVSETFLSNCAASWKSLRNIDFSCSPITDNILCSFVAECPYIKTLDISSCPNLTSFSLRSIGKLNQLNVLNISYNEMTDLGHLSKCENLYFLTMKQCVIYHEKFASMLAGKSKLKFLDLTNCKPDNFSVLNDIFNMCPQLHHLYLNGWKDVPDDFLTQTPKNLNYMSIKSWSIHRKLLDSLKSKNHSLRIELDEDLIIEGESIVPFKEPKLGLGPSIKQTFVRTFIDPPVSQKSRKN